MNTDDLQQLCFHVGRFGQKADWQFIGLAVVHWEFPTMVNFMNAKSQMLDMLYSDPTFLLSNRAQPGKIGRDLDEHTWEVDCRGVTFRLSCRQVLEVRGRGRVTVRDIP